MANPPLDFPVTVLLLGSGELGKELTISLKRLGAYVVACDHYENAPAMAVADEFRVFPMTDGEALRAVVAEVQPALIVPEVERLAVDVLAEFESPECRVVPNAAAVALTFDRRAIRKMATEVACVPTSPYRFAESFEELVDAVDEIGFPCFVKPTMSSSGHGQSYVTGRDQLRAAWEEAQTGARAQTNCVIVEGKIDFDYEITLLTVRAMNRAGAVSTYFCSPIGHIQVDGDYRESWQPQRMTKSVLEDAEEIARRITDNLAAAAGHETLTLGLFGVEMFVAGSKVYFSEVSPRPHDTGLVTLATQAQSEFDLHARAILGLPVKTDLVASGASAVIKALKDVENPVYHGVAAALNHADDVLIFGKPHAHRGRRMGVALASGRTVESSRARATAGADCVVIGEGS